MKKLLIILLIFAVALLLRPHKNVSYAHANSSYVVVEESSGRVLMGENENNSLPMASTTKIMTALVVLDNCQPDEMVKIHPKAVGIEGSSIYLRANEEYSVLELLYGLMLRSGNDSAVALAIHVGGCVENFVTMMNAKSQQLGLKNTNFTNPHGLHHSDHYTSAYDLAMITREAFRYDIFAKIVATKCYQRSDGSYFYNKNKMLSLIEGGDGVKTGYTTKSGRCLVSSATRDGMRLICVVLNHYDMWHDSVNMLNKCFEDYSLVDLRSIIPLDKIQVNNAKSPYVDISIEDNVIYPLGSDEIDKISYSIELSNVSAPLKKGEKVGNIKIFLDNCLLFSKNLCTIDNVEKKNIFDIIKENLS